MAHVCIPAKSLYATSLISVWTHSNWKISGRQHFATETEGNYLMYVAWPQDYKTFSMLNSAEHPCSIQLSVKFFLFINVKMPTIVGILTFLSRNNSIVGLSESDKR